MPNWKAFNDIPFDRRFSITKANMLDQCPGRYAFCYEEKIKEPLGTPIWNAQYFEWLLEGSKGNEPAPELSKLNKSIIKMRYDKYMISEWFAPDDKMQIPIKKEIPNTALDDNLGNYYLIGFLDRRCSKIGTVIDHKFAGKPWDLNKFMYNKRQAQGYVFATGNKDFRYDILNLSDEKIQIYPKSVASEKIFAEWISDDGMFDFLKWIRFMISIMNNPEKSYKEGPLCNWCYYNKLGMCPEMRDTELKPLPG